MLTTDFLLTYCTNIHPGESLTEVEKVLFEQVPKIRAEVFGNQKMGVGVRLSALAAKELNDTVRLKLFKEDLDSNNLFVFTMNGFPYGNFHGQKVKDNVHAPDWTTRERLDYTFDLIDILGVLLPDGQEGGISTSPVSYKFWFSDPKQIEKAKNIATKHLVSILFKLEELERETGKYIHLDIEPEPDGLLENTSDVIDFFENFLIPESTASLISQLGVSEEEAKEKTLRYITICYDVCHFALAWEDPEFVVSEFNKHSIQIGKVQISAALEARFANPGNQFATILNQLSFFSESTYLHQVTVKKGDILKKYRDLDLCIKEEKDISNSIWRIHFHVPVFVKEFQNLFSTQEAIIKVLELLKKEKFTKHLEIETYTWEVLPAGLKEDLNTSICRELDWVINNY